MAHGHVDVNLPRSSWHRAATFLADFARWLQAEGFSTWTVRKEPGNHLTAFWLYARLDDTLPAKSRIQFGCTKFAEVNPSVHAYARGKAEHLSSAVALLQKFVRDVWAALGSWREMRSKRSRCPTAATRTGELCPWRPGGVRALSECGSLARRTRRSLSCQLRAAVSAFAGIGAPTRTMRPPSGGAAKARDTCFSPELDRSPAFALLSVTGGPKWPL